MMANKDFSLYVSTIVKLLLLFSPLFLYLVALAVICAWALPDVIGGFCFGLSATLVCVFYVRCLKRVLEL